MRTYTAVLNVTLAIPVSIEAESRDEALEIVADMTCDGTWQNHVDSLSISRHEIADCELYRLDWADGDALHCYWPDEGYESVVKYDI